MKKKIKRLIVWGIVCLVLLLVSSWYSINFNNSRLVSPMDFGSYVFQVRDLPMIISVLLTCAYGLTLLGLLILKIIRNKGQAAEARFTRKLNPKLGLLGFLGFLGFGGFWTFSYDGSIFPFVFFLFFGFFGFYYEGKMSGTFMDERFRENAVRAELKASNIAFTIIFVALVIFGQGAICGNLEYNLIAIIITLSLALALRLFMAEYLLYHYDHDDQANCSGE
ncbi:MAG: DUF3796 domain-containing protein [Oscillospiraceae bacterium]